MTSTRGRPGAATWTGIGVVVAGVALDQATKAWALRSLRDGTWRPLLGDRLGLQLVGNAGAAFSLGRGSTWVFTVVASAVCVGIAVALPRLRRVGVALPVGLVGAGALGNLIDRLVREPGLGRGRVVDFINYNGWFVGNVADVCIVVGAAWLALAYLRAPAREDAEDSRDA